jgi:hypothetical protein
MSNSGVKDWHRLRAKNLYDRARIRYERDPEYREAVRVIKARTGKRLNKTEIEKSRIAGAWVTVDVNVGGTVVPMFTIAALAKALSRSLPTIRAWEKNGVIPRTPHRTVRGDRLYPVEMIEQIYERLSTEGKIYVTPTRKVSAFRSIAKRIELTTGEVNKIRLYYVGALAHALGLTSDYVVTMESKGHLPETPLRYSKSRIRLYTLSMIEAVRKAYKEFQRSSKTAYDWGRFFDSIELQWIKQRIVRRTSNAPDARVLEDG